MVLLIIIPMKNCYFIGGIPHFQCMYIFFDAFLFFLMHFFFDASPPFSDISICRFRPRDVSGMCQLEFTYFLWLRFLERTEAVFKWPLQNWMCDLPGLVNVYITMENHHTLCVKHGKSTVIHPFSLAFCMFSRSLKIDVLQTQFHPPNPIWASQNSFFHTIRMIPRQFGHQKCREFSHLIDPNEANFSVFFLSLLVKWRMATPNKRFFVFFFGPWIYWRSLKITCATAFLAINTRRFTDRFKALAFLTTIDRFFWPTLEKKRVQCNSLQGIWHFNTSRSKR